jgi:hypothetical protein
MGVGMEKLEFDERYPAIFQPGGDELPRTAKAQPLPDGDPLGSTTPPAGPVQPAPERSVPAQAAPLPQLLVPAQAVVRRTPVRVAPAHERYVPERDFLPPVRGPVIADSLGSAVPPRNGVAIEGQKPAVPVAALPEDIRAESLAGDFLPGVRQTHWGTRSWIVCTVAALAAIAAGLFCIFASALIPSAGTTNADGSHGLMVTPWGTVIAPAAPSLIVAGLGILAGMFLLGSLHYPARTHWLRAGAALVGVLAIVAAGIALFAANLFPEMLYATSSGTGGINQTQLWMVVYFSSAPLTVFALAVLSVVAVVRPGGSRAGGAVSGMTALLVGGGLLAGAAFALFAPQLFPKLLEGGSIQVEEQFISIPGWPYVISGAGASIALVGAGVFLWGVLIMATTRKILDDEVHEDVLDGTLGGEATA